MILVQISDFVGQYGLSKSAALNPVIQSYIDREEEKTIHKLLGPALSALTIAYIRSTKPTANSGLLVIGSMYEITSFVAGDDFTNVGAASNTTGVTFIATETTPTVWTNASVLTTLTERYENLLRPFFLEGTAETLGCRDGFFESMGLKDLLLIQIYYCYLREEAVKDSQSGLIKLEAENSGVQTVRQAYRKGEQKWNVAGLDTWLAIRWFCKYYLPDLYPEYKGQIAHPRYSDFL